MSLWSQILTLLLHGENYTLLGNMLTDSPDKIITAIFGNNEIMKKCENNRFWLDEREFNA